LNPVSLREEVTALLQALLRVNTVNPPGNETHAADLLREYLVRNGVEAELYALEPERANLVARIRGGDGPSLAFLCHTDTVLADPVEWDRDPWSGDLVDDEVWGRGALDMKDQVAASAVAFASLAREGFRPSGDLLFIATADEEVGGVGGHGGYGLRWLVEEHPEAARCDFAINEGGGDRLVLGGKPVYLCATAEKMSAPFTVRVHGRSGHGSMPGIADNALVKAARYIEALGAYQPPRELIPEAKAFFEAVLGEAPSLEDALDRAAELDPILPALAEPLLAFTLSPTMIDASHQRNVIPALCEIGVDCRLLPETSPADVEPLIRAALGDGSYDLEFSEAVGGSRSPIETPLWGTLERFIEEVEPDARVAPIACPGFTDSHYLREAYGTVAYGFFPLRTMDAMLATTLVHSANERIPVDDLEFGVDFLRFVAHDLLGA
jgi:acetylornithine deacetylase/succinyl-diaminopimelate desuccinylase-like protein